tara:strand:- start:190 stop:384 length:195 start_codon:yes stop_codon:yes gene_type:complete
MTGELLSIREFSVELWGSCTSTHYQRLERLASAGKLKVIDENPAVKQSRKWIPRSELKKLLGER